MAAKKPPAKKPAAKKPAPKQSALDKLAAKAKVEAMGAKPKPSKSASAASALPSSDDAEPPYEYPKGFKKPRTVAAAADLLYTTRTERLAVQKQAEALEETEKALKHWLIETLPKGEASGVAGKIARVAVVTKEIPRASDWHALYGAIVADYTFHVKKKDGMEDGAFALLSRKLGNKAVNEMWAAGKEVAGVGKFTVVDVSLSKL